MHVGRAVRGTSNGLPRKGRRVSHGGLGCLKWQRDNVNFLSGSSHLQPKKALAHITNYYPYLFKVSHNTYLIKVGNGL